jgi:hypothetical protein
MKKLVSILICSLLLANVAFSQRAKEKSVKVQIMNYPVVAIKDVKSYKVLLHNGSIALEQASLKEKKGLKAKLQGAQDNINNIAPDYFSYSTFSLDAASPDVLIEVSYGEYRASDKQLKDRTIPCKREGEKLSKDNLLECPAFYYEIPYTLPFILKISDKAGKTLLLKQYSGEGINTFGYDASGMSGYLKSSELEAAYSNNPGSVQKNLSSQALISKLEEAEQEVQKAFFFYRSNEKIQIASATGKGLDYSTLDVAQEMAISGFEKLSKSDEGGAKADFEKAIATWKKEVAELNMNDDNARINRKIATDLYANLALIYMHIWDLENALTSVSEAQKLVKYASNLTKKDEIELLAERIAQRKLTFESYLANKHVKGTETKVENILEKIRVKETSYKVVTNEDKYNTFLAETNGSIPSQATLVAQTSQSKSTSKKENPYEAKVQKSSLQGYMLLLNSFIDGKFESLPLEICEISYLNELTIPYNTLKSLPSEIGKLTELKKLNLNNNKLTSIPAELGNLKNLTVLNIKGNAIPQSEIDHIQKMLPNCKIKF